MRTLEKILLTNTLGRRMVIFSSIVILGWIDLATGFEYSFSVFYLMPVSIAAWYDSVRSTILPLLYRV